MFKKPFALILAAFLLLVSLSAASASGLFSEMIETDCTDERLERLDEIAETISLSQTTDGVTVEVSQAYYEGNRVYISYRADGRIYEQDGLELEDGAYADIIAGGSAEQEDGSVIGWKECVVPEDEQADPQTFCLVFRTSENGEKNALKVTLAHHEYDRYLEGVSPAADYRAHAILYTGKADLKGVVILTSPEQAASWIAWQEGEEGTGTDVIACWNLYRNGELISYDLFGASEVLADGVAFSVMFPYMEDLSGLALVPEYSEAGEKPDEAIVLEPMETASATPDSTVLYYHPEGGEYYHVDQNCRLVNEKYLPLQGSFTYAELGDEAYKDLKPCNVCGAPRRPGDQ